MKPQDRKVAEGLLFTDQYHLTSAQLYHRLGLHERRVQFDYFFRRYPNYGDHQAGFCVFAGFEWLYDWMTGARAGEREIELLRAQMPADWGEMAAIDSGAVGWPDEVEQAVSAPIRNLLVRTLAPEPLARPSTDELKATLSSIGLAPG